MGVCATHTPQKTSAFIRGLAVVVHCARAGSRAREDAVWSFTDGLVADAVYVCRGCAREDAV